MARIGIDLGTTYSVIATMESGQVIVLSNAEGRQTTPSVVFFPDSDISHVIVGEGAVFSAATSPDRVVRKIKRYIGTDHKITIDGNEFTPEQISAEILKKLKVDAESALNGEAITEAVVTVPAWFQIPEREATKKAAEIAGLNVVAILSEPIAAAIDFQQTQGEKLAGKTVMVYDLGGGTFDVTIMRVQHVDNDPNNPLEFTILGKEGARELGGLDWDAALADYVCEQFAQANPGKNPKDSPISYALLLLEAQKAKELLSMHRDPQGKVSVSCVHEGITHAVPITRAEFENLTLPLLQQTADLCNKLMDSLKDKSIASNGALLDDGTGTPITWDTLDFILLAGGSTKMPSVSELLERITGRKPVTNRGVDFNVGRGAAYVVFSPDAWTTGQAKLTPTERKEIEKDGPKQGSRIVKVGEIAHHSVGVKVYDEAKNADYNHIIIKKATPVNSRSDVQTFMTYYPNQAVVDLVIYKGESSDLDAVDETGQKCVQELGSVQIAIEPRNDPQPIALWLQYNADGIITGEAVQVLNNRPTPISVSIYQNRANA